MIKIFNGDVIAGLKNLPDNSVDCCVTSPPYWGLRCYGVDGQIGQEKTLGEHIDVMVGVFEEVRRVLKPHGTLWVNYGDCYATTPNGRSAADTKAAGTDDRTFRDKPMSTIGPIYSGSHDIYPKGRRGGGDNASGPVYDPNYKPSSRKKFTAADRQTRHENTGRIVSGGYLKPKDLCMIPNRLAIAMQEAGWYVRSEIVWGKPNAMPDSSGIYRPATAHEKIFLFCKSGDATCWRARDTGEFVFEEPDLSERLAVPRGKKPDSPRWQAFSMYFNAAGVMNKLTSKVSAGDYKTPDAWDLDGGAHGSFHKNGRGKGVKTNKKDRGHKKEHTGFNQRWDLMTREEQQENGRYLRNYEPPFMAVWEIATAAFRDAHFATFPPELVQRCLEAGCPPKGLVLDPFGGAGTTALVADHLGLDAHIIELNSEYCKLAYKRIEREAPMFTKIETETQKDLFLMDK